MRSVTLDVRCDRPVCVGCGNRNGGCAAGRPAIGLYPNRKRSVRLRRRCYGDGNWMPGIIDIDAEGIGPLTWLGSVSVLVTVVVPERVGVEAFPNGKVSAGVPTVTVAAAGAVNVSTLRATRSSTDTRWNRCRHGWCHVMVSPCHRCSASATVDVEGARVNLKGTQDSGTTDVQ